MKMRCFKNLFKRRPKIIKSINNPRIRLSEEMRKELEEDMKKIFTNPIRNGNRKRGRRSFGKITSLPLTRKHREGYDWLFDDDRKNENH